MNFRNRIAALEAKTPDRLMVFADVPLGMAPEGQDGTVRVAAKAQGINQPFDIITTARSKVSQVRITGAEPIAAIFDHVAKHGRRLGMTDPRKRAKT